MSATTMGRERKPSGLGSGLAGFCLVIAVAWALVSVLELTGTLTAATQIKARVKVINAELPSIHTNLTFIRLAGHVGVVSGEINTAAKGLSAQAGQILTAAQSIDTKVSPILRNAQAINTVVKQINANALAINTNVQGIGASVNSIGAHVSSIAGSVASINNSVNSIHSRVTSVFNAVGPIGTSGNGITPTLARVDNIFTGVRSTVNTIQPGIVMINVSAGTIIRIVNGIKSDLDAVLGGVGLSNGTATILGHANSIDCASLINLLGATQDCNK